SNYAAEQKCDFKLWQKPVPIPCPQCDAKFLTRSGGKKPMLLCATKECGYKKELDEEEGEGNSPTLGGAETPPNPPDHAVADGEAGKAPAAAAPAAAAVKAKVEAKPAAKVEAKPAAKAA